MRALASVTSGGGGAVGRNFSQTRKNRPRASMARPVHRLMLRPSALSMSASDAVMPAIVTMTPYTTNRPPMRRRMSKRRAAVADLVCSAETSSWTTYRAQMSVVNTVLKDETLAAMPAMNAASRPVTAMPRTPLGSSGT